MYIYIVYIHYKSFLKNLHMSKKSSTFAAAKVLNEENAQISGYIRDSLVYAAGDGGGELYGGARCGARRKGSRSGR